VVGLALWLAVAAERGISAAVDLRHARSAALVAKRETSVANVESGPLTEHLSEAASSFHQAHVKLGSVAVRALDWVPLFGRQIRSARALAGAGERVADAASQAVNETRAELTSVPSDGTTRLARMRRFLTIATTAQAGIEHLSLGPDKGLLGPLAKAHNDLASELNKVRGALDRGVAATKALVDLTTGQHRVLVLVASNAEMRAESGMPEDVAVLSIDNGSVHFTDRGSSSPYVAAPGAMTAPADFTALWGWMGATQGFEEMLASPRFDVTAPIAARLWQVAGQGHVDAVMLVDPTFLQAVLQVTGPVAGPTGELTAGNVVAQLLHGQYLAFPSQGAQTAQRKEELGQLAGDVFGRLDGGGYSFVRMGVSLAAAARGRGVVMWSSNPSDEAAWLAAEAGGALAPTSFGISIENRGQNKLDYALSSQVALTVQPQGTSTLCTAVLRIHNGSTSTDPIEVNGPSPRADRSLLPGQRPLAAGDYLGIVAVSLPGTAANVRLDGQAPRINGPDGPTRVVGDQYEILHGQDLSLTLTFTLPGRHGTLRLEPSARVPGTTWVIADKSYDSSEARTVSW
jgi:hypothetical protein